MEKKDIGTELAKGALGALGGKAMTSVMSIVGLGGDGDHSEEILQKLDEMNATLNIMSSKLSYMLDSLRRVEQELAEIKTTLKEVEFLNKWMASDIVIKEIAASIVSLHDELISYTKNPNRPNTPAHVVKKRIATWERAVCGQGVSKSVRTLLEELHVFAAGAAGPLGGTIQVLGQYYAKVFANDMRTAFTQLQCYVKWLVNIQILGLQCQLAAYQLSAKDADKPTQEMYDAYDKHIEHVKVQLDQFLFYAEDIAIRGDFSKQEFTGGLPRGNTPRFYETDYNWKDYENTIIAEADEFYLWATGNIAGVVFRLFPLLPHEGENIYTTSIQAGSNIVHTDLNADDTELWWIPVRECNIKLVKNPCFKLTTFSNLHEPTGECDGKLVSIRKAFTGNLYSNTRGPLFRYIFHIRDLDHAGYRIELRTEKSPFKKFLKVTTDKEIEGTTDFVLPLFHKSTMLNIDATSPRSHSQVIWPYSIVSKKIS